MCKCRKDISPLMVDGKVLHYLNYQTFNYLPEVDLVLLKKEVDTPLITRTSFQNILRMSGVVQYVLVSREEADELLKLAKRGITYFLEIANYNITNNIIQEI